MDKISMLYALPFIAALIGWITNYLAVKMLFRPKKPLKMLFFSLQGVFPKRQKDLAKKISEIIAAEFLASEDLKDSFGKFLHSAELKEAVKGKILTLLKNKVAEYVPLLPTEYIDSIVDKMGDTCQGDFDNILSEIAEKIVNSDAIPDVQALIEDRIANFPVDKLEQLCQAVLHKEFRFIEVIGGVLGFIVGLIQMFIANFSL